MRVSGIPYVIFGHSMGSFITRVFLTRHAFGVRAAVLCGTGHQPRPLSTAGKALTSSLAKKHGERYVSELVDGMGAGGYGRAIKDAETDLDWIATDAFGVRAAVLCGTGHQPRPLSAAGKALTSSLAKKHGERYVCELVDGMGAGGYGRAIKDAETDLDWIATDPEVVAEYQRDPLCGQKFTVGAYHVLTSLVVHWPKSMASATCASSLTEWVPAATAGPSRTPRQIWTGSPPTPRSLLNTSATLCAVKSSPSAHITC